MPLAPEAAPVVCVLARTDSGRLGVMVAGVVREARSLEGLGPLAEGRRALVVFDGGDASRPVVIGLLAAPVEHLVALEPLAPEADAPPTLSQPPEAEAPPLTVWADGREVRLEAYDRLELRCGEASLTLHRDGKVEIRGTHVLSRASGPNRIKGGSVSIN